MADSFARKLTDAEVRNARPGDKPYKMADGGGLYLLVQPNGARLWRYKFRTNGKEGVQALGVYPEVTLAAARIAHQKARATVADGVNPVRKKRAERQAAERQELLSRTGAFPVVADEWLAATEPNLRACSIAQRKREIKAHLIPEFRHKNLNQITRAEISNLLKTVEKKTPTVARNLRGYLDAIFERGIDLGLIEINPVPPVRVMKKRAAVSHRMMAVESLPDFLARIDSGMTTIQTSGAMKLLLLTVCRKSEVAGARWSEFDLDAAEWIIPAERMKKNREHYVPLSRQAVTLLRDLRRYSNSDVLFPHRDKIGESMAGATFNALIRRLGFEGDTVHGFRSIFSTRFNSLEANPDVIERCLAHVPKDATRAAYNRHEYKKERREMLQQWADWLDQLYNSHSAVGIAGSRSVWQMREDGHTPLPTTRTSREICRAA